MTEIFEEVAETKLIQPTFITDYPTEVSPLSRKSDHDPESWTASSSSSPAARWPTPSPS